MGLSTGRKLNIGSRMIEDAPNSAPTLLIATVVSASIIKLDWTKGSTNNDGTKLYISLNNSTWVLKGTVIGSAVTMNATGLSAGTKHYFKVAEYNGNNLSSYSNTVDATTSS